MLSQNAEQLSTSVLPYEMELFCDVSLMSCQDRPQQQEGSPGMGIFEQYVCVSMYSLIPA